MKLKSLAGSCVAAAVAALMLVPTFENGPIANAQSGFYAFNGHLYQVVDTQMNYYSAVASCSQEGAHVVTITTPAENAFVTSLPLGSLGWLGATDEPIEGLWRWVTGEPFSYTNWAPGEPTNEGPDGAPENALAFWGDPYPGQWNDLPTWHLRPFVCEFESLVNPMPSPTVTTVSGPTLVRAGSTVSYEASVLFGPDNQAGTVTFASNTGVIPACHALPLNVACETGFNVPGAYLITASYSGAPGYAASTAPPLTVIVARVPCQTLSNCNLANLNLANLDLQGIAASRANLKGANLNGTDLRGAILTAVNLNFASLAGTILTGAILTDANLNKVIWSSTICPDGTNSNSDGGTCLGHLGGLQ